MRLALFGGTFDPVHDAHLEVARAAPGRFELAPVLFAPAYRPPHKTSGACAPFEDRFRMVSLACRADGRFLASRLEQGAGNSYSIDTITKVRAALAPADQLFFLIGEDAFADIRTWRRWREVILAVEFVVVSRPGFTCEIPDGARVHRLGGLDLPVSSTEIRRKLAAGLAPAGVPSDVLRYIGEHALYRDAQM